jgi:holo-[acyl-carrier protein] synthase
MHVGIDLVSVDSVRESLEQHGEHYLRRVFTTREVDDSRTPDGTVSTERLAGRFAAKEATLKALGVPADVGIAWSSIEVVRDSSGRIEIELTGRAAEFAANRGGVTLSVSITHEGPFSAAVVVAESERPGN